MPHGHISKRTVNAFVCPSGKDREILWNDALPGFGLVAFPSGRKCYCAQYRQAGQSHRIAIGQHGRLTPDEARREAKKLLGAVEMGANPVEERRAVRAAPTVADLITAYLEDHATKLKPGTAAGYAIALAKVQATFGNIKAEALTRTEAARLHHSLAATPYQANRTLAALSALYTWSERHGHLPEGHGNPARGIKRYREQGRERFLTAEELNRLGEALREAETTGWPWETNGALKRLAKEDNRARWLTPLRSRRCAC
jgi:hypothetical protein